MKWNMKWNIALVLIFVAEPSDWLVVAAAVPTSLAATAADTSDRYLQTNNGWWSSQQAAQQGVEDTAAEDDDFAAYYGENSVAAENEETAESSRSWPWNTNYYSEYTGRSGVPATQQPRTTYYPATAQARTTLPTTFPPSTLVPSTFSPTTLVPTTFSPTTLVPTTFSPTTLSPTTVAPTMPPPPTTSPTRSCQDDPYYRDPINYLPCEEFYSDECLLGAVFGGMDVDQVTELLAACPFSCSPDHTCQEAGALQSVSFQSTFRIANTGYLGESSVEGLQDATSEYLSRYMRSKRVRAVFPSVSIVSEAKEILETTTTTTTMTSYRVNEQQRQQQQQQPVFLQITVSFEAIVVGDSVNPNQIQPIAEQGLLNNAYARALQYTGDDSFSDVYISFQTSYSSSSPSRKQQSSYRDHRARDAPFLLPPLLAASSAILVAATGYFLRMGVEIWDKRKKSKPRVANDGIEIIDVEEYYRHMGDDEEMPQTRSRSRSSAGSKGRSRTRSSSKGRSRSRSQRNRSRSQDVPRIPTFDSYYYEDNADAHAVSVPEITMVDSSGIVDFLRYDQYNEGISAAASHVTDSSLNEFVQRIGGNLDAYLADFHREY